MISTSLWHISNQESELRSEPLDVSLNKDRLVIHTKYSMVSTGTEYSVSKGLVTNSFLEKMAVPYMQGEFTFPIKYGYACGGVDSDRNLYHYMHPHQDFCSINRSDLFSIETLQEEKVPLISNMETVMNAIWDAELKNDERVAIIGYGNVGSLLAETLKIHNNIESTIIENDAWRRRRASENGFDLDENSSGQYDVMFNTTASNVAVNTALTQLTVEGKLIEMSWYGARSVKLNLGEHFHYNRLRIISSQVSQIPIRLKDQMTYKKRKSKVVKLLEQPCFDKLITDIVDFKKAALFFRDLRGGKLNKGLIYLFKY